ncbi:MAG: TetR family transcriptional regulator [Acidobacteria bacterium]|nr:TetR family transcriptional regulator [Acidobacteriota bacterium]
MPPEVSSAASRRATDRREAILDAAERVFAREGFHGATVGAIARECGVADGTLYNYFAGKRALVDGLLDRLADAEGTRLRLGSRAEVGFADLLRAYVEQRLRTLWESRDLLRALLPELLCDPRLRRRYGADVLLPAQARGAAAVRAAAAAGELEVDVEHLARVVAGTTLGIVMLGLLGDDVVADDLGACADATAELLLRGVSPSDAGRAAPVARTPGPGYA